MLILVATPIGNLGDFSYRAVDTLKNSTVILCEDTRHSGHLLDHYDIHQPRLSYHSFNEASRQQEVLSRLQNGETVSLITDAGTPGISDPGSRLVTLCIEHKIPVTAIPGACAATQALVCSGLSTDKFQFVGFLPRKKMQLRYQLLDILFYSGTTICYESPKRLVNVLKQLQELAAQRQIVVGRELTKRFEEFHHGTVEEQLSYWQQKPLKGEVVLLIKGAAPHEFDPWLTLTPQEHVVQIQETFQLPRKEAIKLVAELRGSSKRELYQNFFSEDS